MYESFQPDYEGAKVFYENLSCQNANELFVFNAEQYFMNKGVEYSIERDADNVSFNTSKGLFPDFITFLRHHIAQIENQ